MSQLEEALRRAGGGPVSEPPTPRAGNLFVSPWAFGGAPHMEPDAVTPPPSSEPTLVRSPGIAEAWFDRLLVSEHVDPLIREQFRRLATTLHHAQTVNHTRIVLVASATAGDGKTLTAINLALALSESLQRRVLLIDADLRRPSIGDVWQVPGAAGLGDNLKARTEEKLNLIQLTERLTLLPAGSSEPDPTAGLASASMRQVLEEAAERFDWVVLDSPPLEPTADTNLLVPMIDTALLVVRAGRTRCQAVQNAIDALGRDRILGVVLNGVEQADLEDYAVYYDSRPRV